MSDDIIGQPGGERDPEERRLYLLVREDIQMSRGKLAAQAGHAFVGVVEAARRAGVAIDTYLAGQQAKIAVAAKNEAAILRAAEECRAAGLPVCVVTDAGRTEFGQPTLTCMAVGPVSRDGLPRFVQRMRLLPDG